MTGQTPPAPSGTTGRITRSVEVPLPPAEAFRIFTRDLPLWWPEDRPPRCPGPSSLVPDLRIDPREGGQIREIAPNRQSIPWATITAFQPGRRFALLWHRDADDDTEVEITFTQTQDGTRVTVIHTGFVLTEATGLTAMASHMALWPHRLFAAQRLACPVSA